MMGSLTATLSGFGHEMEVVSDWSPGDPRVGVPKPIGVWLKDCVFGKYPKFPRQKWSVDTGSRNNGNGWAADGTAKQIR